MTQKRDQPEVIDVEFERMATGPDGVPRPVYASVSKPPAAEDGSTAAGCGGCLLIAGIYGALLVFIAVFFGLIARVIAFGWGVFCWAAGF